MENREIRKTNLQKIVEAIVIEGACPYQQTALVHDKVGMYFHTEIRVGGERAQDGFIRNFFRYDGGPYDEEEVWTGHFFGQKFTLKAEHTANLIKYWPHFYLIKEAWGEIVVNEQNYDEIVSVLYLASMRRGLRHA